MYEKSVNEETQEVTLHDMVDMFWVFTKRMATFTDQGLQVTIKGEKRQYEVCSSPGVPDHEWRSEAHLRAFHRGLRPLRLCKHQTLYKRHRRIAAF